MWQHTFGLYWRAMALVEVETPRGTACGSAFHIGGGYYVSARHVVDAGDFKIHMQTGQGLSAVGVSEVFRSEDADVAVIHTTATPEGAEIALWGVTDDWVANSWIEFVLSPALVMGYPPVPFASEPRL